MSDRISSFTVILEENIRDDDAKPLMDAIRQMRGVLKVTGNVSDLSEAIAESRVKSDLTRKLLNVLKDKP